MSLIFKKIVIAIKANMLNVKDFVEKRLDSSKILFLKTYFANFDKTEINS